MTIRLPHLATLLLLFATLAIAEIPTALAHPPGEAGEHDHHAQTNVEAANTSDADAAVLARQVEARKKAPTGIVLPQIEGPTPWSDKPVLDDPNRFQIAIMTDRTGGHRPGVWMKGVRAVNRLRPDFVMSVGDLIEGYTEDQAQVEREWQEFLGFIEKMEMKFFFVAGNHDVTNPMMHRVWREHFGPTYYSFDYKGVHFICLCSEDPNFRIGDEQLEWLAADLEKARDARWTLVFLHKPLWFISERYISFGIKDGTNWKPVEKLLYGRKHTVFAGHTHFYSEFHRNGTKFYQLATTGGGSQLRGVPYGEFDHIMWLTMEDDGPRVVNLLLDGIVAADEVTEEKLARFRNFLAQAKIEVAPILLDEQREGLTEGRIDVRLTNQFDRPIQVAGKIEGLPLRGLTVDPVELELEAGPGESKSLSVKVQFGETIPFAELEQTVFRAQVASVLTDDEAAAADVNQADEPVRPLRTEQTVPVVIDRRYPCATLAAEVSIDGDLDEWGELAHRTPTPPVLLGPAGQWQGNDDASLAFSFARDDKFLYLAARVTDDRVLDKDELMLMIDGRPIAVRSRQNSFFVGCYRAMFPAVERNGEFDVFQFNERPTKCRAAVKRVEGGYVVEAALPLELVTGPQGDDWHSFQCTPVALDVDDPQEQPVGVAWRGTQALRRSNKNFGHFVKMAP
ncbi:MAG: hypothetical protein DWQ42_16690 [Planctomycetota bacterium]|nr:MAG: hypothetical protein DWQ42_16690 [Planctomycetota bacterium]REK48812.1 MAG: hypothetical protein DWQ46_01495 [Planctomycetota bacterium]